MSSRQTQFLFETLVQREGTDAFLDAKNALRVVRRKFGMMTLISRMASTMEQRNIASVRVHGEIDQETLLKFGKLMSRRVDGTSTEEEEEFRRQLRRLNSKYIDVLFHVDVVGRKVAVPWLVKEIYSRLAIISKREGSVSADRLQHFRRASEPTEFKGCQTVIPLFEGNEARPGCFARSFPDLLKAANERLVLTATAPLMSSELRAMRNSGGT